jgi:NAD(P)H-flavin reductase
MLIKARGDFSGSLEHLVPGTPVRLDVPHGHFGLHAGRGDSVYLIAGGIGISPVMSVLRHLHSTHDPRPISLLYGARNLEQLVYADEISAIATQIGLRTRFFLDEPPPGWSAGVGPLTEESVRAGLPDAPETCLCLVCGPTPLMNAGCWRPACRPDRSSTNASSTTDAGAAFVAGVCRAGCGDGAGAAGLCSSLRRTARAATEGTEKKRSRAASPR